ncbi:MAG: hypothetical protein E7652_01230 [Ruminococcaceae bacterium]|nr:hypothetical protein [Oscillospiraceae bacterium]
MATERSTQNKPKPMKMHLMDMLGLLAKNKKIRVSTDNKAYNDTLDRDIMTAIKRIEKEESALLEMQYPLSEPSMLHGYMGLKSYILNLYYENTLCNEYNEDDIRWLIETYCNTRDKDEVSASFNIYNIVYLNALFCDYLKKEYGTLKLTEKDCKLAQSLLGSLDVEAREEILFACARRLTAGNVAYNNKTFLKYLSNISTAIKRKNLASFLVVDKN